ncbi:MAG TPA: FecR domain-containing protein [bacterium]|jgi:hypothetical protein|nr:FecR domain-containing protein [bacterium]HPG35425.1 FecR domain-containing protein [bacterium]HPM45602.1 FecR domain-containing protein [bacterium]HQI05222.1 FecR domain-containing protein [bacterium]HQM83983.1 FecR domain-containing protein [bacterium]
MEQKLHINIDEVIALFDKNFELLPETVEHIEKCPSCSALIEKYSVTNAVLQSGRHVTSFPDMNRINEIAERSFFILHEGTHPEKEMSRTWHETFRSFFKPLVFTAAAASLLIAIYFGFENPSQNETMTAGTQENDSENKLIPAEKTYEKGLREQGEKIHLSIAKIEALAQTQFNSISENEISMGKGKAKFDVVSGNDFRVTVNGRFMVRVLGTSFILDNCNGTFSVNVIEGLVEVVDRSDDSQFQLSANMEKVFEFKKAVVKNLEISMANKSRIPKTINIPKLNITPDQSFLFQGREALDSGNEGAALQLFMMEMENGKEKDKALFEAVRLHESKKQYNEMVSMIDNNKKILDSSRVYREELLIKGCTAQKKISGSDLSLCRKYLEVFPEGYRKNEIRELINE